MENGGTYLDTETAGAIVAGRHSDPFAVLGLHKRGKAQVVTAFAPGAESLWVQYGRSEVEARPYPGHPGLFEAELPKKSAYRLRAQGSGGEWIWEDAFRFGPVIGEMDEYLLGEELSVDKHEYLNGVVYMMAGASAGHDRITMNISGELHALLRGKPCEAFSADTRVHVRTETAEFYYYPDVTVDCTGRANDSRYSESPRVIFEVLSPATERVDRGEKLQNYQRLASLEAYVLVDQLRVAVTTYRRTATGWETELLVEKDDVLALGCVDCQLPLTAIYERTGL